MITYVFLFYFFIFLYTQVHNMNNLIKSMCDTRFDTMHPVISHKSRFIENITLHLSGVVSDVSALCGDSSSTFTDALLICVRLGAIESKTILIAVAPHIRSM
jgi:hypothetical protein